MGERSWVQVVWDHVEKLHDYGDVNRASSEEIDYELSDNFSAIEQTTDISKKVKQVID